MKKLLLLIALFFFSFSFIASSQTIITAAGTLTWTVNGDSNVTEVTLTENAVFHDDGFDGAMFVTVTGAGITFTNSYHLSNTYGAAVQEIVITNSGGSASTFNLSSTGNLGSDFNTFWHYTSTTNARYTISSDNASPTANGSDPVISLLYGDAVLNGFTTTMPLGSGSPDNTTFTISNVPIAAGTTKRFLILAGVGNIDDALSNRPDQAFIAVTNLTNASNWPADFTSFLSPAQRATVMNWSALSALPLTWESFTAQSQNGHVTLNWSTANEINTKNFIVQYSTDGIHWSDIGVVTAAGNSISQQQYHFIHAAPVKGNNFYRILQNDLDDKKNYSAVRKIVTGRADGTITVLDNPVKNNSITILLNEAQVISLSTANGKLIWQKKLNAGTQPIDVSQLAAGIYTLRSVTDAVQVMINK